MSTIATAYGLTFDSDLDLPELPPMARLPSGTDADVHIRLGSVPVSLVDPAVRGVLFEAHANSFLFRLDDVARFLVTNGNEIVVEPEPGVAMNELRVFLLGTCLGALLHQRGLLVLHAAAVHTDGGAVLFCGRSGVGKSTLLGALLARGYQMIVDDVCAVELDQQKTPIVLPGYPRTRLWADSAERLNVDTSGLTRTRASIEKFERQAPDDFWPEASALRAIYVLDLHTQRPLSITPCSTFDAFEAVLAQTYRSMVLTGVEMRGPHFAVSAAVAAAVPIRRIERPEGGFDLDRLADAVERDLAEIG